MKNMQLKSCFPVIALVFSFYQFCIYIIRYFKAFQFYAAIIAAHLNNHLLVQIQQ